MTALDHCGLIAYEDKPWPKLVCAFDVATVVNLAITAHNRQAKIYKVLHCPWRALR